MRRLIAFGALACAGLAACGGPDVGSTESEGPTAEAADALLVSHCDYLDTASGFPVPGIPINFNRELVIRDLGVVTDPCRTTLTPTVPCAPGTVGIWTFATLMSQMAGSVPPGQFIADWLHSFEVNNVVNGFPVPLRPLFRPLIIEPWLVASGCAATDPIVGMGACPLDLTKAPFKLLAIVNRVDISDWALGVPPTRAGEARFVFGFLDAAGNPLPATVILEYGLPNVRGGAPYTEFNWANDWHVLSDAAATGPLGSPTYNAALQTILGGIVPPGSQPGNPNFGAAIGQVRTNEIAFGPAWKLREYRLKPTGAGFNAQRLRLDPLDQTPDDSLNITAALDGWLNTVSLAGAASPALHDFVHQVPVGLQGGESTAAPPPIGFWDQGGTAPLTPRERHHLGLATCNGCHTAETGTAFTHIGPSFGMATLSGFLGVSPAETFPGSGVPAAVFNVPDPSGAGPAIQFNEPFRRVCEVAAILGGHPGPLTKGNGG